MAEVLTIIGIVMLPKNMSSEISFRLSHDEFKCRCKYPSCHFTIVAQSLQQSFDRLRKQFASPLKINSGFRCQKHNHDVGGVNASSHTTGHAIDISISNLSPIGERELITLARTQFDFVKVYENFIHCHNDAKDYE